LALQVIRHPGRRNRGKGPGPHWLLGVCACFIAAHAGAQPLKVTRSGADCAPLVHIVAKDAPLSQVLKLLSTELDFKLQFDAQVDPRVTLDASKRAMEWLDALGADANLSVSQARDAKCPGQYRVARVWVLPIGKAAAIPSRPRAPSVEYRPQGPGTYDGADRAHTPD
jgi:hypothetical protein